MILILSKTIFILLGLLGFILASHIHNEKTIYKKPDGSIWYRWLDNSNTWQFEEII
jgi:hypothetical protein